ncbi:MAG: CHAT domain-containing tetratricopeptide repeat protein, partial [Acidobacteriota bacterium]
EAARHFQRTLTIYRQKTPGSPGIPWALQQLGLAAIEASDLEVAESHFLEAREFLESAAPGHLFLALNAIDLANVARHRGRLREAERLYRQALERFEVAGTVRGRERALHGLGLTLGRQQRHSHAAAELQRAVTVLEEQLRRLGGSRHAEAGFRARHRQIYDDALTAELAAGRPERAFHLLERSRARSLLAMLTERDLDFARDLSPALAAERRDLERRHRAAMDAALASADPAQVERRRAASMRLREEQEGFEARLRRASPRFAALRYPAPHGVAEVRQSLDPGTVLLAYHVVAAQTHLFVLTPEAGLVASLTLSVGAQALRQQVDSYLDLLTRRRDPRSPFFRYLNAAGRELYDLLIAPAEATIEGSERLLIVADGALHRLPFAALVRPSGDYLVAWRPIHTVLSATLYEQLGHRRSATDSATGERPATVTRLAAFGDPHYPPWVRQGPGSIAEPRLRSAVRGGLFDWQPLPHSRREVEGIAQLYDGENVRLHLGAAATEDAVRALDRRVERLHFAVHGHFDDRAPLNSALALTMPEALDGGRHNGLLQAWEIFDSVRLEADLVVLSACSTALGQERGGEGLVGLVHAFHYAGARSLLASLWNVDDRITAELMIRFHRHLRSGLAKDEALRAAQLELVAGPIGIVGEDGERATEDVSAPFYWAAFELLGARSGLRSPAGVIP